MDFQDLSGENLSSYTTPPTSISLNGTRYRCLASNSAGSATSVIAFLSVGDRRIEILNFSGTGNPRIKAVLDNHDEGQALPVGGSWFATDRSQAHVISFVSISEADG